MEFLLKDLTEKEILNMTFSLNGRNYEFDTNIIQINDKHIFLEPIKINGQVLNFNNSKLDITLIKTRENEKPLFWGNCNIQLVHIKQNNKNIAVYVVNANKCGIEKNRRENFRLSVGLHGNVIVAWSSLEKIIVRDISANGVSFVSNITYDNAIGKPLRLVFEDMMLKTKIDTYAKIVRTRILDDGRTIYGCELHNPNEQVGWYIKRKQQELLQREAKKRIRMEKS